jgi:hypothetical protein
MPLKGMPRLLPILALLCAGCHSSTTAPSAPSLTGTWVGTTNDVLVGTADFSASITQSGSTLSGTYTSGAVQSNDLNGKTGTLTGSVAGSTVTIMFSPTAPVPNGVSCPFSATVTVSGNQMTGTFTFPASALCVPLSGSINLTRST